MNDLIRDAPMGQFVRWVTHNKILKYPEELESFQLPAGYPADKFEVADTNAHSIAPSGRASICTTDDIEKTPLEYEKPAIEPTLEQKKSLNVLGLECSDTSYGHDLERADSSRSDLEKIPTRHSQISRVGTIGTLEQANTRAALEEAMRVATENGEPPQSIMPQRTLDGKILVDWYTTDDRENPQNWSQRKKIVASMQIYLYTLAVYMGSAIYTPSVTGVMKEFHVGATAASLGLALYVLAYGLGPLIFSPLSELPSVGRNPPYVITMAIFVALCIAAPLVDNFAGLLVLRFLQGFFGSPCLATGGASLADMYSLLKLPYVLCLWALAATCGPALGPIISGFSVTAEGWRWSLWEMLWLSGPILLCMLLFLPETSASNILLRRARRLRALTGNDAYRSQSEIDQVNMTPSGLVYEALVRPIQLIVMDPAIGYTAFYVALCYGIYYSFFEAFPIVYVEMYGFTIGQMGLVFLSITVGVFVAIGLYYPYIYYVVEPDFKKNGIGKPERRLIPALFSSFLLPIGLFLFGWTGNGHTHWIVSVIGIFIFTVGVFTLMQCIFVYLPLVYPQYAASLFAGNDFARSSLAFAAILFSRPMYIGMGIGPGTSLMGALTALCVVGIFVLYFFGEKLRARSRFSAK